MVLPTVCRGRFTNGGHRQRETYKGRILISQIVQILIRNFKGSVQRFSLRCSSLQHWLQLIWIQASKVQPSISPGMAAWATIQAGFSTQQLKPHMAWSVFYAICTICNCSFRSKWKHSNFTKFQWHLLYLFTRKEDCPIKHCQESFWPLTLMATTIPHNFL